MSGVQDRVSRVAPWQQSSNHTFSHTPVNWAENHLLWKRDHTPDPTGLPGFRQLPFGDKPLTQAEPLLIAHLGGSFTAGAWYQRTEHEDYKRLFAVTCVKNSGVGRAVLNTAETRSLPSLCSCPAESFQLSSSADSTGLTRGFRSDFYFISNAEQSAGCIILPGKGQGLRQHQAAFWEGGC